MQKIGVVLEEARASSPPQTPPQRAPRSEARAHVGPPGPPAGAIRVAGECPRCRGAGFVQPDLPLGHPEFGKAVPCGCNKPKPAAALPERFKAATFESFELSRNPKMTEAKEKCLALARGDIESVFLLGPPGRGKSHLLAATVRWCCEHDQGARFVECTEMLADLQAAQFAEGRNVEAEIDRLASADHLLALDDLGAHNPTGWREEQLYRVLNRRYNSRAPTIISSNTPIEEIDERIRSRFRAGFVACEGDDLRVRT